MYTSHCTSGQGQFRSCVIKADICVRGGADKSLARPTSRCRRMESIVLLEMQVFLLQRLKGSMSGDVHDFNNIET